jgi:NAD-specific glutamate dehydrogenase
MTATIRMWGYTTQGAWVPIGAGADGTKGVINLQAAIGESGTDVIRHAELMRHLFHFQRLYAEVAAIGGTSTAVTVEIEFLIAEG